jgi:hypothetical protein
MNQFTNNAQDTETSSQNAELRFVELVDQGSLGQKQIREPGKK